MIQGQKFNYSSAHIKKPPSQKTSQCIQFIRILADFAVNLWEHFAPLPYFLGGVCSGPNFKQSKCTMDNHHV